MYYYLVFRDNTLYIESYNKQVVFSTPVTSYHGWRLWVTSQCYAITGYDKYIFLDLQFQEVARMKSKYSNVREVLEFGKYIVVLTNDHIEILHNWTTVRVINLLYYQYRMVVNSQRLYIFQSHYTMTIYQDLSSDYTTMVCDKVIGKYATFISTDSTSNKYTTYYLDTASGEIKELNYNNVIPVGDKKLFVNSSKSGVDVFVDNDHYRLERGDPYINIFSSNVNFFYLACNGRPYGVYADRLYSIVWNKETGLEVKHPYIKNYTKFNIVDVRDRYIFANATSLSLGKCYLVLDGDLNIIQHIPCKDDEKYLSMFEVNDTITYSDKLSDVDILIV